MGLYDAIHRLPHSFKDPAHPSPPTDQDVFMPDERLSFAEALWLYTVGAAYACRAEERLGRLEVGYSADFVVLDRDVTVAPAELLRAQVQEVWVHGVRRFPGEVSAAGGSAGGEARVAKVDGPYVPGKNGSSKAAGEWARRRGGPHVLAGKRGHRCCGR